MAPPTVTLVDTTHELNRCLVDLQPALFGDSLSIAVDLEGVSLSRHGCVSIVQMMRKSSRVIWLLDVTVLGRLTFDHVDPEGRSIRAILESQNIKKILYDVRNDADALWNLYAIDMGNVYDLQMLELAVRHSNGKGVRFLNGLARSIDDYVHPSSEWKAIKDIGIALFSPEKGGTYDVFEARPLDPRILEYCAQDVVLLFDLEDNLESCMGRRGINWRARIIAASARRVAEAKRLVVVQGRERALAPSI